jgi:hypothetical protein
MKQSLFERYSVKAQAVLLSFGALGATISAINHFSFITLTATMATLAALGVLIEHIGDLTGARRQRDHWIGLYMKAETRLEDWEDGTVLNRFATYYYRAMPNEWTEIAPGVIAACVDLPQVQYCAFIHELGGRDDHLVNLAPEIMVINWRGGETAVKELLAPLRAYGALAGEA